MKKLTVETAKVRDLFKEAMAANNDKTPIISMSEKLANNPGIVDMDVPVEPTSENTKKMVGIMEEEVQNNSWSTSSTRIDLKMVKDEVIDFLRHGVYLDTEKSDYFIRVSDGRVTVETDNHLDYQIKADNTILDAKSNESTFVHKIVTLETA